MPAEILVYPPEEWERLPASGSRFARMLRGTTVWILDRACLGGGVPGV